MPRSEQKFRERYKKSPSFLSIHMGVRADVLPQVGSAAMPCCQAWQASTHRRCCEYMVWGVVNCRSARLRDPGLACLQTRCPGGACAPLSCLCSCVSLSMPVRELFLGRQCTGVLQVGSDSLREFAPAFFAAHSFKGPACRAQRCTTS